MPAKKKPASAPKAPAKPAKPAFVPKIKGTGKNGLGKY